MPTLTSDIAAAKENMQLLVFQAANEEYAFPLTEVQEIIQTPALTPVPSVQTYVDGIVNLRGKIVTVINLPLLLGLPASSNLQHIIVTQRGTEFFGFHVDLVTGVMRIPSSELKPVPEVIASKAPSSYVESAVMSQEPARIILILRLRDMLTSLLPATV